MILTVTPNPCVDKTIFYDRIELGGRLRSDRCTCIAGGKGCNVSRAVRTLGHATTALVVVGGHTGAHVVDLLEDQDGVACLPVWVEGMTRTITTVLEEELHRQTAFFEPGPAVTLEEREQLVIQFTEAVQGARVVTFNGTVSDPSLRDLYAQLIPIAKETGALSILDTHGPELVSGLTGKPHMVKPNREEASQILGFPIQADEDIRIAMQAFHAHGVGLVAISLGAEGLVVSDGKNRYRLVPEHIEEINPVGSGDALVAAFAIGLAEGWPLDKTATWGAAAGAANAMSWDIGRFDLDLVESLASRMRVEPF